MADTMKMTTKIKQDSHGLYVRTNSEVYRPQRTVHSYSNRLATDGTTVFRVGQAVAARQVFQSPFCRVQNGTVEFWHGHGSYLKWSDAARKTVTIPSDECWKPDERRILLNVIRQRGDPIEDDGGALIVRGCRNPTIDQLRAIAGTNTSGDPQPAKLHEAREARPEEAP